MQFTYTAKDQSNKIQKGEIQASSEAEVGKILGSQKLFALDISQAQEKKPLDILFFLKKISLKEKIIFTKQLAMMVKGGLPLVEALGALAEQSENPNFSKAITQVKTDVEGGSSLSKALSKHKDIFPDLYISITVSGEKSGKLSEVLEKLADQLQKDYDLMNRVKNAVTYPIVIVVALVGIMILMMIFVVPQLKTIFKEMGVELPVFTRVLLGTSDFLVKYWYLTIVGVVGLVLLWRTLRKNNQFSLFVDQQKIKVPIFGTLIKKVYMARFARTMATLVASGLPMLDILLTVKEVVGNKVYRLAFEKIYKDVESGVNLSLAIKKHKEIFPVMVSQMIMTGEKSGKVDEVLYGLADFYDKEVESTTANLTSLIEPILILIVGGGVGLAIASVILPIYSLVNAI